MVKKKIKIVVRFNGPITCKLEMGFFSQLRNKRCKTCNEFCCSLHVSVSLRK